VFVMAAVLVPVLAEAVAEPFAAGKTASTG